MRRSQRFIASLVALALCSVLAGCGGGGMSNFDPSDLLDFLDTKKKLPGERKPVFPEGVPGLEQGVPKDLYKGARQEQIDQQNANAPPRPSQRRHRPSRRSRKKSAKGKSAAAAAASTAPAAEPAAAADPDAAPSEEGRRRAAAASRSRRSRASAPPRRRPISRRSRRHQAQPTQQSASPFPAPMPSGSFTR